MLKQFKPFSYLLLIFIGFIFLCFINPLSINESGYRQHVRTLGGKESIRFDAGIYFSGFFSKVTDYPDVITVQFEDEEDQNPDFTSVNDLMTSQFNDGTTAETGFTVKWQLPATENEMIEVHKDYRTHHRLGKSLADYSKECMNYSTQLMDSEFHYSGGKSKLREDFQFQLRNGQYILEQVQKFEKDSMGTTTRRYYVSEPKVTKDGKFILSKSDVQEYKIVPNFVAITHMDYDELVDTKLAAKIEQSTKESIAKQTLMTAEQEALTAEAQGREKIARVRATQEAAKIEAVIKAEKATLVAQEQAKQAKFIADKIAEEGRAQAEANRALVAAGLTPSQQMERDIKIADMVSKNMSNIKFPSTMILGGTGNGQTIDPFTAVGLESFMNLTNKLSKN